jgi:hypothetical protein
MSEPLLHHKFAGSVQVQAKIDAKQANARTSSLKMIENQGKMR